jgi:hypothetical protein
VPPRRRTDPAVGRAALTRVLEAHTLETADLRDAVRFLLEELAAQAPGRSVEVRVPPYGAVQCVEGPRHTRGTPPNVVETDAPTWLELVTGRRDWQSAESGGAVRASGQRAVLSAHLPLFGAADARPGADPEAGHDPAAEHEPAAGHDQDEQE